MKALLPFILLLAVFAFQLPALTLGAQDRGQAPRKTNSEPRIALVIGNAAYVEDPLDNPVNDARDMAATLREFGFEVLNGENLNHRQMEYLIREFGRRIRGGGVGLFYFAGHGAQVGGSNYLIPSGAEINGEAEVKYEAVDAGFVLAQMEEARNRLNIVILDACRNNQFARSFRSPSRGLASIDAPVGTLIAYATAPGRTANDGQGKNGLYTKELLAAMKLPGLKIKDVFKRTRAEVRRQSKNQQIPWESSSAVGDFYFSADRRPTPDIGNTPPARPVLIPYNFEVASLNSEGRIIDRWREQARYYVEELPGGVELEMAEIPGGTFLMGSSGSDIEEIIPEPWKFKSGGYESYVLEWVRAEAPQHRVTVTGFFMGKYEVTQAQWRAVANLPKERIDLVSDPSEFNGSNRPVEDVSWEEAAEFCERLSRATGRKYRLPTEAEWEYAARAGTTTPFHFGETITAEVANFGAAKPWKSTPDGTSRKQTTAVGSMGFANAFGLYDMHGNVWEWCQDWYDEGYYRNSPNTDPQGPGSGSYRVFRGGSWRHSAAHCRSAFRFDLSSGSRFDDLGFRLVRQP